MTNCKDCKFWSQNAPAEGFCEVPDRKMQPFEIGAIIFTDPDFGCIQGEPKGGEKPTFRVMYRCPKEERVVRCEERNAAYSGETFECGNCGGPVRLDISATEIIARVKASHE
jgi:hypothetical protein